MPRLNSNWNNAPKGSAIFHSSPRTDRDFGFCNHDPYAPELMQATPPVVSGSPSSVKLPPQPASYGLGNGIEVSHSSSTNPSYICANLIQEGSCPINYPNQIQTSWPAQATAYAINQIGIYFDHPDYIQYPIRQEQQPVSYPQSQRFPPSLNVANPAPSLPLHHSQVHGGRKRGNIANHSSPGPHACDICGIGFKRQTDLNRHLKTARVHRAPHGPVCPELGCKYTARFTRVDNFQAHYRRQHGKSSDEAARFIQEWKDRGSP